MDWQMIGAIGEVLGAAAVVVTLFYLAREVREASQEARRNRWSDLNNEISRVADSWGRDTELSKIVFGGFTDPDSLAPHEMFRFYSSLFRMFRAWEATFEYSREGGVHQWGAEGFHTTMTAILGFPGAKRYWKDRGTWFSPDFRREIEAIVDGAAPVMLDAYGPRG